MGNKQGRENKFLDKEYAERIQAENALAYGNYAGATWHDARADRWGYKADKTHYRTYNKSGAGSGQAYALHPVPPAGGIAAYQPGLPTASHAVVPASPLMVGANGFGTGMPLASGYPAAVAGTPMVGAYDAGFGQAFGGAYPSAGAMLPAAYSGYSAGGAALPATFGGYPGAAVGAAPVLASSTGFANVW